MFALLLGIVAGAAASWAITRHYYVKGTSDQQNLFNKLSNDLRQIILDDRRESMSVEELSTLLEARTIDKESDEEFPYKVCPKCGSENLDRSDDVEADCDVGELGEAVWSPVYIPMIKCDDCGWSLRADQKPMF